MKNVSLSIDKHKITQSQQLHTEGPLFATDKLQNDEFTMKYHSNLKAQQTSIGYHDCVRDQLHPAIE